MKGLTAALPVRGLLAAVAAALPISSVTAQHSEATRRLLERKQMLEPAIINPEMRELFRSGCSGGGG